MSDEELEKEYLDLMERLNDFLIGVNYPVHVCIGALASCIAGASAGVADQIGIEGADREFYSLLNAIERAYAAGTDELRKGAPDGETIQ
jgi:hypothetical protein